MASGISTLTDSKTSTYLWLGFTVAPWLLLSLMLWQGAVNAPRLDDFEALFAWHKQWQQCSTVLHCWETLFSDYQNHRWVFIKLPLLLTDSINFKFYAWASPFFLALAIYSIYKILAKHQYRWQLTVLASICFCNFQLWTQMQWAPIASAMLMVICLTLYSCWLYSHPKLWTAGLLLSTILCLVHGGGILILLILPPLALWQHYLKQTTSIKLCCTLIVCLSVIYLYFIAFPPSSNNGYSSFDSSKVAQHAATQFLEFFLNSLRTFGSVLLFNSRENTLNLFISAAIGSVCAFSFMLALWRGVWRDYPALIAWIMFIAGMCASIAAGRALTIGPEQTLQSHYKLLSNVGLWIGLASIYLLMDKTRYSALIQRGVFAIAITLYTLAIAQQYPVMQKLQQALWQDVCQWQQNYLKNGKAALQEPMTKFFVKQPNKKLQAAYDSGFYRPDCSAD